MSANVLREWIADVLPIRAGALYVQLAGDDDVAVTARGDLATTIGVAVLGPDDEVLSFIEGLLGFAHRDDLEYPDRTKAFLRAWSRHVVRNHDGCDADAALLLTPVDVSPNSDLLEVLEYEDEDDFFEAFGDRRHWDSSPDVEPPPLDITDLSGTKPVARSPEHEHAIEGSKFDREAFLAYARWLHERNDPRGSVGVFEGEGTRMGKRRAASLMRANTRYFYGPFPTNDWDPHVLRATVELDFALGWVDGAVVRLGTFGDEKLDATLATLFRLPSARFLRDLELSPMEYAYTDDEIEDVMKPLLATGGHPMLRELALPSDGFANDEIPKLRRAFPRLGSITLRDRQGDTVDTFTF